MRFNDDFSRRNNGTTAPFFFLVPYISNKKHKAILIYICISHLLAHLKEG
jgi:hypothetical protein